MILPFPLPGSWRLIAAGVAAVAVMALVGWLWWRLSSDAAEIARLEDANALLSSQLDQAVATAENNAEAARQVQRLAVHREEALARERDAAIARGIRLQSLIAEIDHAAPEADGPVANVLRSTIGRLREPGAAAAPHHEGGGDPAGSPAATP